MDETPAGATPAPAYNYSSQRGPQVLQGLVLALLVYGVLDGMLINPYVYLGAPPWTGFAAAGIAGLVLAAVISRGPPPLERAAICLLFAAAVGAASYPLALRFNQWTDSDGPQLLQYRYEGNARFQPVQPGTPALDFSDSAVQWPLQAGAEHAFEMVQGSLGFPQLNLQRVRRELRGPVSVKLPDAAP